MTRGGTVMQEWLGLCRKPPVLQSRQTAFGTLPVSAVVGQPGCGGGGAGSAYRGIGAAISGMHTLNRNRQLLWFAILAGLVLAGNIVCQGALCYISWILDDRIIPLALGALIELVTVFCLVFLLAGLFLSISSIRTGSVSLFGGLSGTKKYTKAIVVWSLILAGAGMLLYQCFFSYGGIFWTIDSHLSSLLTQYPFTLNLNPSTFAEIPGYGGRSVLFWTYPYGFENALTFLAINLLLMILTAFVLPQIVLEQKTLRDAVAGSVPIIKTTWAEIATCAVFLGVIVSGVFLTFLLVQAAHGIFTPAELIYDRPSGPFLVLGYVYYLAVFSVAFVMATVGGIAALEIYQSAKTCCVPESMDPGFTP